MHRYDSHSGGEREIQRTMLELLNQLDGFDSKGDVKVHIHVYRVSLHIPLLDALYTYIYIYIYIYIYTCMCVYM